MKKNKTSQRVMAMTLSIVMVLGTTPWNVLGYPLSTEKGGEIISFQPLEKDLKKQTVPLGTSMEELNLPDTLWATMLAPTDNGNPYQPEEETFENDESEEELTEATPSFAINKYNEFLKEEQDYDTGQPKEYEVSIPVTWHSEPEYDGEQERDYLLTPELLSDYTLADGVQIPEITVTVDGSVLSGSLNAKGNNLAGKQLETGDGWTLEDGVLTVESDDGMMDAAFNEDIRSVVIKSGVTRIDDFAFYYCTNLTEVEIAESVTSIGSQSFSHCTALEQIQMPNSLISIGNEAFMDCFKLDNVFIPASVTNMQNFVFANCTSLKEVTFLGDTPPENIEKSLFYSCTALKHIYVPTKDSVAAYKAMNNLAEYGDLISVKNEQNSIVKRTAGLNFNSANIDYQDKNGDAVTGNPLDNDIVNTSEGWAWYRYENEALGYSAKTLVLDGIDLETHDQTALELPSGSTIVLANKSENIISTANEGYDYGIDVVGDLTIAGNGKLFITAGNTSALGSIGLFVTGLFSLESGTVFSKVYGSNISDINSAFLKNMNPDIKTYHNSGDDYDLPVMRDIETYILTYQSGGSILRATDVMFVNGMISIPSALVADKTVSGITGTPLSGDSTITISLTNDVYSQIEEGEDVSDWFSFLPMGVTAKVKSLDSESVVSIIFSGTPGEVSDDVMEITIPADKVVSESSLTVTSNDQAKFDIVKAGLRKESLNLLDSEIKYRNVNGNLVSKDPTKDNITDTSEGWKWYRTATGSYGDNTLLLNGINLKSYDAYAISLPDNAVVLLENGSNNTVKSIYEGFSGSFGIYGDGNLTIRGFNGTLNVTGGFSTNSNYPSAGIGSVSSVTIQGGIITTEGFRGSWRNYGIYSGGSESSQGVFLQGGEVNAIGQNATMLSCGIYSEGTVSFSGGTVYASSGEVSNSDGKSLAVSSVNGIIENGVAAFQKVEDTYTKNVSITHNDGSFYSYIFDDARQATDIRVLKFQFPVSNAGGTGTVVYPGEDIDLTAIEGLFSLDNNAGSPTYTVEKGGTGEGSITGTRLTVTKTGTIQIGLVTSETNTHQSGQKVTGVLTVNKGVQPAPKGLNKSDVTALGGNDGKITGLLANQTYEYKKDGGSYVTVNSNEWGEITGLFAGTYVLRLKGNDLHDAGEESEAIIIKLPTPNKSSEGSKGGSSSSSQTKPTAPVTGAAENKAIIDNKGNASTTVTDKNITDAIVNANAEALRRGVNAGEVTVAIRVSADGTDAKEITINLPKTTQQQILNNKISGVELTIESPDIVVGMNHTAIEEIYRQANGDVQIIASKIDSSSLLKAAKDAIGGRPAFDFKASYESGTGNVTDFGNGTVYVSIPYTPQSNEVVGHLYAVYVDSKGNVSRVPGSAYDVNTKSIIFTTNHFSVYGISYEEPAAMITDTLLHWAKDSIDYVVGRGLMEGTSATTFDPDKTVTKGAVITALGRLAGLDASISAIEWAKNKGIIPSNEREQFTPDSTVTREEMAVLLANYAKATGYSLPLNRDAVAYSDASNISTSYKDSVKAMQQAGIIMGEAGNQFNPKGNATRALVSAMLHRYVKLTIHSATARGWAINDAGQSMYYKDGIAVSGKWFTIEGKYYYFNADGSLAKNTKIDGYEVDQDGVRK